MVWVRGHQISYGRPNYVVMDRKPGNGCEIQDVCDGRIKVMIQLKLVKGAADNELLAAEDPVGGLHGTRVMKQLVWPWANSGIVVSADSYCCFCTLRISIEGDGFKIYWRSEDGNNRIPTVICTYSQAVIER